jgi:O-antigen ligase
MYLYHPPADARLTFFGRASHPIFGAGAIATGAIAAVALLTYCADGQRARMITVLLSVMTCVLVAGVYLSGSRGPVLALAFALGTSQLVLRSGSGALLFASAFAAFAFITASVLLEAHIKELLCPMIELACRPSVRHDVWAASIATVMLHPFWGSGYGFRFEGVPHAHNAYLGMGLHYGIPLCILFICLMALALANAARMKNKQERFFVVTMLIFANGFMGSDLSDPMRFFNTHYLILWFPLFLALVSEKSNPT